MDLSFLKYWNCRGKLIPTLFPQKILSGEKKHTIRENKSKRWKEGMKIHFITGARTSNRDVFKEGECTGTQDIVIGYNHIEVDGQELSDAEIDVLAKNDGFETTKDFWSWFIPLIPYYGSIIHWTDKRY